MEEREIQKNFNRALSLIKEDKTLDALFFLDKIVDNTNAPEVLSSYALCIALERGKVKDAVDMCIKAINMDQENAYHYLNLGKIYLKENKKAVAIDIFRKGLKFQRDTEYAKEIGHVLDELGIRKKMLFPFLKRDHFLNKYIGLVFSKLKLR